MANTMRTGSIDLAVSRVIELTAPLSGVWAIQLDSADVSASTDLNVEVSLDGTNWDVARESGTDITDTLVQAETTVITVLGKAKNFYRINFEGATTGTVTYLVNR